MAPRVNLEAKEYLAPRAPQDPISPDLQGNQETLVTLEYLGLKVNLVHKDSP